VLAPDDVHALDTASAP